MGKDKNVAKPEAQKPAQVDKLVEQRKKAAEGSTKPLPTNVPKDEKEAVEMDAAAKKAAEEAAQISARVEAARKMVAEAEAALKAVKDKAKAEREAEKNAKKALAEKSLAERMRKQEQLDNLKAAVMKAEADLALTEEAKLVAKLKAELAAVGPLPKVKVRKGGGERAPRAKRAANGVTPNMLKVLDALSNGSTQSASELAASTGILKGKRIPEMVEAGLLNELVPDEGQRGKRYTITAAGKEALQKALAEEEE